MAWSWSRKWKMGLVGERGKERRQRRMLGEVRELEENHNQWSRYGEKGSREWIKMESDEGRRGRKALER